MLNFLISKLLQGIHRPGVLLQKPMLFVKKSLNGKIDDLKKEPPFSEMRKPEQSICSRKLNAKAH